MKNRTKILFLLSIIALTHPIKATKVEPCSFYSEATSCIFNSSRLILNGADSFHPEHFAEHWNSLTYIDLSNTKLSQADLLNIPSSVEFLIINNCLLEEINALPVDQLISLRHLDISYNPIVEISNKKLDAYVDMKYSLSIEGTLLKEYKTSMGTIVRNLNLPQNLMVNQILINNQISNVPSNNKTYVDVEADQSIIKFDATGVIKLYYAINQGVRQECLTPNSCEIRVNTNNTQTQLLVFLEDVYGRETTYNLMLKRKTVPIYKPARTTTKPKTTTAPVITSVDIVEVPLVTTAISEPILVVEEVEEVSTNELPETGTSSINLYFVGGFMILLGLCVYRKRKSN